MNDYGRKISGEEYERQITALPFSKEKSVDIERKELDIIINHRLGIGFPESKRIEMFAVRSKKENIFKFLFDCFISKVFKNKIFYRLEQKAIKKYKHILSEEEIKQFLDL